MLKKKKNYIPWNRVVLYQLSLPILQNKLITCGSDAHYLWDIRDKEHWLELEDEPYSGALVRQRLIDLLRRGL